MPDNHLTYTSSTPLAATPAATQSASQVLESCAENRHNEPLADFAVRVPHSLLNLKLAALYPTLKSVLSGTLTDDTLDLTLTWKILPYPELVVTKNERFTFTMEITLDTGMNQSSTVQALCNVFVQMIKKEGKLVLKVAIIAEPFFFPNDEILKAIFKSKRAEFQQQIDNLLGLFIINADLPDLFPPMEALIKKNYPVDSPIESVFKANLLNSLQPPVASDQQTDSPCRINSHVNTHAVEDAFRIQLTQRLLLGIIDTVFWDPLDKEFSEDEATIKLEHYTLDLEDDELVLSITLSGRIKKDIPILPDPEWWIDFKSPLVLRLKIVHAPNHEIRIQYSTVNYPSLTVEPYNGAAEAYEFLIPTLEFMVSMMVQAGLTSKIKELVTDIDEPLYKLEPFTHVVNNTPITVTPDIQGISSTAETLTFTADFAITV